MSDEINPFALSSIEAAPPPEPEDANPFALTRIEGQQSAQQRVVLRDAVRTSPDDAAEVARLRRRYGTPDDVLLRNLRDVQLQEAVDKADEALRTSPRLARALSESSLARQAHDDLPALARIESGFAVTAAAGAAQATLGVSESIWRTPQAASRVTGYLAGLPEQLGLPRWMNPLRGVQVAIDIVSEGRLPYFGKLFSGTTDAADAVGNAGKLLQDEATFGSAFADLQRLSQNADLALAHAARGNGQPLADVLTDPRAWAAFVAQAAPSLAIAAKSGGSLTVIGWLEGMEQASSAADFEQRTGQKVSDADFTQALVQTAAVNALLERYGLDKVLGAQGKGLSGIFKAMAAEGGTEALQQINTNLAEALSFNADQSISEGVLASTMGGAGSGGGAASARSGVDLLSGAVARRAGEQARARAEAERLQALLQAATDSRLRERSPEDFRAVVQQLAEEPDGTDQAVHVDGAVLNQLAPEVLATLPEAVRAQVDEAAASGGSVAIPVADVLTVAPGTPLADMLAEHGRVGDPAALSRAEAEQAGQQAAELLRQDAQRVIEQAADQGAAQASFDAVRGQVLAQLTATGRHRAAVNDGMATWTASFYAAMGARLGLSAEQFAAKYPLRIVGETGAAGQALSLAQGEVALSGEIDEVTGLPLNADGTVTVYHHTSASNAAEIRRTGVLKSAAEPDLYFTTTPETNTGYGDTALAFRVNPSRLQLDDEFPDGRQDFRVDAPARARRVKFTADGQGQLQQSSLEPGASVAENGNYETDLFGNPIQPAAGKPKRARSKGKAVHRDVPPEPAVPGDTSAPAGDYSVRTVVGVQAERKLGASKIASPAEAAAATQYLYRSAVERFDGIVTDKDGKPLAVIGGFKGALAQTSVYPATLMGEAIRVPGAAFVWFSHNHPSGKPDLSSADESLNKVVSDVFRGSGIEPRGLLAVGNGKFTHVDEQGIVRNGPQPIPADAGETTALVIEREQLPSEAHRPMVDSPDAAKRLAQQYYESSKAPGLLLLDSQLRVNAWVPLPADAMGPLRDTGGLAAVYRAVSEANAGAALIVHAGELSPMVPGRGVSLAENIGAALQKLDVRALDVINAATRHSAAERGLPTAAGPLYQQSRGSFNPQSLELALSPTADLSTFFHETGHFFLEVLADVASQPDAPADVVVDMAAVLKWFGVETVEAWRALSLDQQRPMHERFAQGIEQYLMEGKAPSKELQPLMRRFRAWVLSVYRSLQQFAGRHPDTQLNDDVRRVFDRLLATQDQIAEAEEVAGLLPDLQATAEAQERLAARSIRDLKWARRATDEAIRKLQREADALRREQRIEARREIMTQPLYRAWQFLAGRVEARDRIDPPPKPGAELNPALDSLLVAVAKLGGLSRESAANLLGVHPDDFKHASGVFGKPTFRKTGGLSADAMGERLAELGYLLPKDDGRFELRDLEEAIDAELRGQPKYSVHKDFSHEIKAGEGLNLQALAAGRIEWASLQTPELTAKQRERIEQLGMAAKTGGIDVDLVADLFGFPSGVDLVKALAEATSPREAVEALTDQRMLENHADLADQRAIERAALEAVHNEARARVLASELRSQGELLNERTDTGRTNAKGARITVNALAEAARQFGQQVVAATPLRDLRSKASQHQAAARRAARRWQEATAKGKTEEAVQAKRDQLLNHEAARAALDALDESKAVLQFFGEVTKGGAKRTVEKGRDPDVVMAARAVLAAYGVGEKGEQDALDYLDKVREYDPGMYDALQPSVRGALALAQPLEALSVEQLRSLHEEIQALWHLAKRSRQLEVDGRTLDMEDAIAEVAGRLHERGVPEELGKHQAITPGDKRWLLLRGALARLRRVEQWSEGLDGAFGGPVARFVFRPIKQAAERYRTDKAVYLKAYEKLLREVEPHLKGKGRIEAPELGYSFGADQLARAELLHAILHTGNESNKRKLLLGRGWAELTDDGVLDTSRWDAFIARMHAEGVLTKAHYDFAQGVWDLLERTKPGAQRAHRDVFGRYFDEVTADAFDTPWGSYRGGYVPAQADPRQTADAGVREAQAAESESMAYSFPSTPKGFTKARVEYNRPLTLDLGLLAQHIDKVLRFTHLEAPVRDVTRLVRDKAVSTPLHATDPAALTDLLLPWLNTAARQSVEDPPKGDTGRLGRLPSLMRRRAGMATMFANVSNTLQQLTGFASALAKLKADGMKGSMLEATALYLKGPATLAAQVAEASPYMAQRMDNEVAAMHGTMHRILLDASLYQKAEQWSLKHSYFLQSALDNTMGPIIWRAAFDAASTKGLDDAEAVRYADSVIRQTQGTTLPEDVSRMETGSPWLRLFTQFTGYFNMMANTNGTQLQQIAGEVGLKKGAGKALYLVLLGLFAPLWIAETIAVAMRGGPDDEDKDGEWLDDWIMAVLGKGTAKGLLAFVPVAGQFGNMAINRVNSNPTDDRVSLSPAINMLESAVGGNALTVYQLLADKEINRQRAVRDVASLVTMITGVPVTAAARPVGYLLGVDQGRIEPTSAVDAVRGSVTGVASPESRSR